MFPFFEAVIIERTFKDLPKHLASLSENAAVVGRDLVDRFWKGIEEINRRVADIQKKNGDTSATKQTTSKSNSCEAEKTIKNSFLWF